MFSAVVGFRRFLSIVFHLASFGGCCCCCCTDVVAVLHQLRPFCFSKTRFRIAQSQVSGCSRVGFRSLLLDCCWIVVALLLLFSFSCFAARVRLGLLLNLQVVDDSIEFR